MFSGVDKAKSLKIDILNKTEEILNKEYKLKKIMEELSFGEIREYNEWKEERGLLDFTKFLTDKANSMSDSIK